MTLLEASYHNNRDSFINPDVARTKKSAQFPPKIDLICIVCACILAHFQLSVAADTTATAKTETQLITTMAGSRIDAYTGFLCRFGLEVTFQNHQRRVSLHE